MLPTFSDTDSVIVSSLPFLFSRPCIGDIVVFKHLKKIYVKRIGEVKGEKYFLVGDNQSDSWDSRKFGFVDKDQIKGKVIMKL